MSASSGNRYLGLAALFLVIFTLGYFLAQRRKADEVSSAARERTTAAPHVRTPGSADSSAGTAGPLRGQPGISQKGVLTGLVRGENGMPISGARVTLTKPSPTAGPLPFCLTDSSGRYVYMGLASGMYQVVCEKEGYAPEAYPNLQFDQSVRVRTVDFTLRAGRAFAGRVVQKQRGKDQAVAGAEVSLQRAGSLGQPSSRDLSVLKTKTGDDGSFVFAHVGALPDAVCSAVKDGVTTWTQAFAIDSATTTQSIVLRLPAQGGLKGQVVNKSGQPVAGATVSVLEYRFPGWRLRGMEMENGPQVRSDATGKFELGRLAAGQEYRLKAEADGYAFGTSEFVLADSGKEVKITLEEGIVLRGKVVSGLTSEPLGGIAVLAESGSAPFVKREAVSGPDGKYEFAGMRAQTYTVKGRVDRARQPMWVISPLLNVGLSTATRDNVVDLTAWPGMAIRGNVYTKTTNTPVSQAHVVVMQDDPKIGRWIDAASGIGGETDTGEQGEFSIEGVLKGKLVVRAEKEGMDAPCEGSEKSLDAQAGRDVDGIALYVTRNGEVSGTVLDEKGKPLAGHPVVVMLTAKKKEGEAQPGEKMLGGHEISTGADGRFHFGDLPLDQGRMRVATAPNATAPYAASPYFELTMTKPVVETVMQVGSGGAIEGTVHDGTGRPLEGAQVTATITVPTSGTIAPTADYSLSCPTDAQGKYRLDHLPEGTFVVKGTKDTYLEQSVNDVNVRRDAAAKVDLVLDKGSFIDGRLVDLNGKPWKGIEVQAYLASGPADQQPTRWSTSEADGQFALEGLPHGDSYLLQFHLMGLDCPDLILEQDNVQPSAQRQSFVLPLGGSVGGTLRIEGSEATVPKAQLTFNEVAAGKEANSAGAYCHLRNHSFNATATPAADGTFHISTLPYGVFQVVIAPERGEELKVESVSIGPDAPADLGTLRVKAKGWMTGDGWRIKP